MRAPLFFLELLDRDLLAPMLGSYEKIGPVISIGGYVHDNNTGHSFPKVPFIKNIKATRKIVLEDSDVVEFGVKNTRKAHAIGDLLFARTYGQDHLVLFNNANAIGKEFYKIWSLQLPKVDLALYFNSTFSILQREVFGLVNLGGGGIKFSIYDLGYFVFPENLKESSIKFPQRDEFLHREIKPVFEECGIDPTSPTPIVEQEPHPLPDRKALDDIVFDALELTEEERTEVYRAVCQLVWNRISKANSVKKRK